MKYKTLNAALTGAAFFIGQTALADGIALRQPIACSLGDDCVIQQYVDHDPGPGASDFRCGAQVYDGHKGTDFRLLTEADIEGQVAVLAAADGTVTGTRNDMPDHLQSWPDAPDIAGRECGNGLVINHEGGWETQYCHMAMGSVSVSVGQQVKAGDTLGLVGASGETEFPHLHLSLRRDGAVIDPFDPDGQITCGAPSETTLWAEPLDATPGGLLAVGFSDAIPEFDAIKAGTAGVDALAADGPAIVIWGFAFGTREGDEIRLTFTGPQGETFATEAVMDKPQAQMFRAGGRRTPEGGWPEGSYQGRVEIWRDGVLLSGMDAEVPVQ